MLITLYFSKSVVRFKDLLVVNMYVIFKIDLSIFLYVRFIVRTFRPLNIPAVRTILVLLQIQWRHNVLLLPHFYSLAYTQFKVIWWKVKKCFAGYIRWGDHKKGYFQWFMSVVRYLSGMQWSTAQTCGRILIKYSMWGYFGNI